MAKIRNVKYKYKKRNPLLFLVLIFDNSPLLLQKQIFNGSKKEIYRTILVIILYFNSSFIVCNFYSLGMVNVNYSICDYVFCFGNGYYLICINTSFIEKALQLQGFIVLTAD